jgi:hypothetical protein
VVGEEDLIDQIPPILTCSQRATGRGALLAALDRPPADWRDVPAVCLVDARILAKDGPGAG